MRVNNRQDAFRIKEYFLYPGYLDLGGRQSIHLQWHAVTETEGFIAMLIFNYNWSDSYCAEDSFQMLLGHSSFILKRK